MTRLTLAPAAALALALAACSPASDEKAADAPHTFEVRPVLAVAPVVEGVAESVVLDAESDLAAWGAPVTEATIAAYEWFMAGDCSVSPPAPTSSIAATCTHDEVLLMGEVALDRDHIASATQNDDSGGGFAETTLVFTDAGVEAMTELTTAVAATPAPGNRIAVLVSGEVILDPAVAQPITSTEMVIFGDDALAAFVDDFNGN